MKMTNHNMRLKIRDFGVLELCQAAGERDTRRLEHLLALGVDPNARFDDLDSVLYSVEEDWTSGENNTLPASFFEDETEEPPLYRAASYFGTFDKTGITVVEKTLLEYGADPYALFRQRIFLHRRPAFPGDYLDEDLAGEELLDLENGRSSRCGIIYELCKAEFERFSIDPKSDSKAYAIFVSNQCFDDALAENEYEDYINHEDQFPHKLGVNNHSIGQRQRRLLQEFLDLGVDPKVRNTDGHTALEMFFASPDDDSWRTGHVNDPEAYRMIGEEVVDGFVKAGYNVEERTTAGQSLLHLVATVTSRRSVAWFRVLQAKGLDPLAKDKEGNTPLGFAKDNGYLRRFVVNDRFE